MKVERVEAYEKPEQLVELDVDCIWVQLPSGSESVLSRSVQWLDWKMRGQLSSYLNTQAEKKSVVFFPSMKRVKAPYVVLDSRKENWDSFLENCSGLKLKKVLYFSPSMESEKEAYQVLKQRKGDYPESIFLTFDEKDGDVENA